MAVEFGDDYTPDEHDRDAERKREKRKAAKLVQVDKCADKRRRNRLEKDDVAWLMWYFAPESGCESPFTYEFTSQQRQMIKGIGDAITVGGDQSMAASRGEGKTTLFERMLLKYTLTGVIKFSVLFAATGQAAQDSLESIKVEIENNERLKADYPEVCDPVRALENTPNRAHYQVVAGVRHDNNRPYKGESSKFSWCGQEIYFPKVPGSPSSGAIMATRGLDSAVRGLKKKGIRPEVAGIDDPDTEDTVRSPEQAAKLETRIERGIGGLGGQKRRVARIMLTTLQGRGSASWKFTDPTEKPSWHPKRFRFLVTPPDRMDLWEEYIEFKKADWQNDTTIAHEFYVEHREAMDAGAVVANPNRYGHGELSALQFYFNEVARLGSEAVATEYDNDPPEEASGILSGISANRIQHRLSGYARGIVPPHCKKLSRGIDVKQGQLHWVVKAWATDATNYVIDYGVFAFHINGIERSIRKAIIDYVKESAELYAYPDGEIATIGGTLVDSGWQTAAVYRACFDVGRGVYPAKGHGISHGCATPKFSPCAARTDTRRPGDGWFLSREVLQVGPPSKNVWLAHCDTDRWKSFEHARWLTDEGKPGAAYVFGSITEEEAKWTGKRVPKQVKEHLNFAKHLTSEVESEEVIRGVLRQVWKKTKTHIQNHWFDASYMADVAASMQGIRLLGAVTSRQVGQKRPPQQPLEEIGAR